MTFKANDSLTEQIAQYLGKQIIQGTMQAGERIQELRIASELEVSRGSVREALLILQRRHLVEIFPRRGAVVSSITDDDVRHFFELWFLLLDQAVCNLATSWQNDDLAHFFEVTTQLAECNRRDDLQGFYEHGVDFLDTLYRYAGNRYLESTLKDLLPLTQRCLFAILRAGKSQMDQTQQFLENLLKTIIARDTAKLRQMVAAFGQQYSLLAQGAAESLSGRH
ncbi:GntR family transcriptional regulator [Chromobacterium sp.]|uniref:GntR family transcriptional regulator n=1 Tax=Chromobacterium sp. TaxID=306190 RepID=UPI0035AE067B